MKEVLVALAVCGFGTLLTAQKLFPYSRFGRIVIWLAGIWVTFLVLKAVVRG